MLAAALARAVDAKDSYTRSHCHTVSQLSALIAAELGFTGDRLAKMRLAGLLHDVGKIGVPDAILEQARGAHRRRVRGHEAARGARIRDRRVRRAAGAGALGPAPPRARRRSRIPGRAARRGDPARVAHHPGRGLVRGDDVGPSLPARPGPGVRARRAGSQRRHAVRSRRRRRAHPRARPGRRSTSSPRPFCRSPRGEDHVPTIAPDVAARCCRGVPHGVPAARPERGALGGRRGSGTRRTTPPRSS